MNLPLPLSFQDDIFNLVFVFFAVVFCFLPCARGIHEMTTIRKNNQRLVSGIKIENDNPGKEPGNFIR